MRPSQLTEQSFASYPPQARALAAAHLSLFKQLPLSFLPLLLRELIGYDWKFPAERQDLDRQLSFLDAQDPASLAQLMLPFNSLKLEQNLEAVDWVNIPAQFSEQLSAFLWSSHQIDAFRAASLDYVHRVTAVKPESSPALRRLGMALVGKDAPSPADGMFKLLRRHGVHYSNVVASDGQTGFFELLKARASAHPAAYAHWYVDGASLAMRDQACTCLSYSELRPVCNQLQAKMLQVMQPGGGGPEMLRSLLQRMQPADVGLAESNPILSRFQLSLLTEGSGTQIFSTTFVEWAAREALRRAQPATLLARFTPRRREAWIGSPEAKPVEDLDPQGSLIDADMGAYYMWINQQRLAGADKSGFVVWHEDQNQAVAIGPALAAASEEKRPVTTREILAQFG